ncbi:unnamed protein product [Rhodiola kirilowii]
MDHERLLELETERKMITTRCDGDLKLKDRIWTESRKIWTVGFPGMLSRLSSFGIMVVTQAFVGHVDQIHLAAYALTQVISVRFSDGILLGMASATETLCGQAFGAQQHHMLGIYLQRSWIIILLTSTLMLPIYVFATPIYKLLGQDDNIANAAGSISLWFIPMVYQFGFNMSIQNYLQAQMRNTVVAWISSASFVAHLLLSWICVYLLEWGISGAMLAMVTAAWLTVLGEFVYIFGGWCPKTWTGFSMAAFSDIQSMFTLSVSSGVMICLEIWYYGVLVLVAGYMPDAETAIASFSICLNITAWQFMISLGFFVAACVRVSNELGRGDAKAVKFSIKVVSITSACIGALCSILCLIFGHSFAHLFASDEIVANAVAKLSPYLAFAVLLNSIQPVLSGVAVGAGMQGVVAYINIGSYYLIGVPVGVLLGYFTQLQIQGMWIGLMSGVIVQTLMLAYMTWITDWDEQVSKASGNLERWLIPAKDTAGDG